MVQGVVIDDNGCIVDTNPATGEVIARVKCTTPEEIDVMIANAKKAQEEGPWRTMTVDERIALVQKALEAVHAKHDQFVKLMVEEMGKPIKEAEEEMSGTVDKGDYLKILKKSLEPQKHGTSVIVRHPLGVVAIMSPWNYPVDEILLLALPSMVSGNTVIIKPSEVVPVIGGLLVETFQSVLPANVMQIVQGDGKAGAHLVQHDDIKLVAMTGSSATGRKIFGACAAKNKRLVLEMGGKDPMVVFDDADLDKAALDAVKFSLQNSGQVCSAIERVYVDEKVYEPFQELIKKHAMTYKVGNGLDPSTDVGPLVSQLQRDLVAGQVDDAVAKGAKLVYKSDIPSDTKEGSSFYPITVLADVTRDMKLFQTETFGPIVAIMKGFDGSIQSAIKCANDTEYGLASCVYSKDTEKANRVAAGIDAGQVGINCVAYEYMDVNCPWVGHKNSGFGFHSGIDGFHNFSIPKTLVYTEDQ